MWHLLAACVLSLCSTDPLDRLERQVSSLTFWQQSYDAPDGKDREQDLLKLQRLVEIVLGVQVQQAGAPPGTAGVSSREHRIIALDGTLSPNAKLQVLAHEAAHILQPGDMTKQEAEVFADAVSLLVTGDDAHVYSQYLAGSKSGLHALRTYRREIKWATTVLGGK